MRPSVSCIVAEGRASRSRPNIFLKKDNQERRQVRREQEKAENATDRIPSFVSQVRFEAKALSALRSRVFKDTSLATDVMSKTFGAGPPVVEDAAGRGGSLPPGQKPQPVAFGNWMMDWASYWMNQVTGEVSWQAPDGAPTPELGGSVAAMAALHGEDSVDVEGYEMEWSDDHSRPYWRDLISGEVRPAVLPPSPLPASTAYATMPHLDCARSITQHRCLRPRRHG